MIQFYFWTNAVLYLIFGILCVANRKQTTVSSGYLTLNNSGWSEYLVIYGGLQFGLAFVFIYFAFNELLSYQGLVLSILLYLPIVIFRGFTIHKFRPVNKLTLVIGFMEFLLLSGAIYFMLVLHSIYPI